MNKSIILSLLVFFSLPILSQIPSYVNQTGLKGWWPFTGNANNIVNNSSDGTVNGAVLSEDRYGGQSSSYYFNGINNWIEIGDIINLSEEQAVSISAWFKPEQTNSLNNQYVGIDIGKKSSGNLSLRVRGKFDNEFQSIFGEAYDYLTNLESSISDINYIYDEWYHLVAIYKNNATYLYVNGTLQSNNTVSNGGLLNQIPDNAILNFGKSYTDNDYENYYKGSLDDIGVWNRELTEQEINQLFISCKIITQQPEDILTQTNNSIQFNVNINTGITSYKWQANPSSLGWVDVPENQNYQGVYKNVLTVNNTTLSHDDMMFRVIHIKDDCIDTSEIAKINILDTCKYTVYDTVSVSITDTLIINTEYLSTSNELKRSIIKVYPNPTNSQLNITFNDREYQGYRLLFLNQLGQVVLDTEISDVTTTLNTNQIGSSGSYSILFYDNEDILIVTKNIIIN